MPHFQKINTLTGWLVFVLATTVYALTVEPTASFWDSGEFIATSYTLGVPHAPGAPLYLLIGRLFSFLAMDNPLQVAYWVNMLSVLCSGLTVMFLFWIITLLGQKILKVQHGVINLKQTIQLIGSGIIGALAFTFSDTFWFSAVEAEVYAMSILFTALVVWAMLRWDYLTDESAAHRWLILIAYLLGLSVGVHILNLLAIPALALLYYFKKYPKVTNKGLLAAIGAGGIALLVVLYGLGTVLETATKFDIFFVNNLGLPFGSGVLLIAVLFFGAIGYGLFYSVNKNKVALNTALLSLVFVWIGYASYTMIVIRANDNPPINLNDPHNILRFVSYLNREQYPSRPLLYGNYFTAELKDQKQGKPVYEKGEKEYEIVDHKIEQIYDEKGMTFLPRLSSTEESLGHPDAYRRILGLREGEKPTFADNLEFLFKYQIGHMFVRYLLWNFAGRESDLQNASWLTPWDAFRKVPAMIAQNKGRNNYLMLPLLLGIAGMFFQYHKSKKGFGFVMMLFFMTGLALVLYTNNPPTEPRERDYVYVGAFMAFAIWIGMGAMGIADWLSRIFKNNNVWVPALATAACLSVPILMATENWDDHDRSDRYFSVDAARNLLASCDENAILFTGGDNDTYPLWYVQNVEGYRTDVRVLVTSFSNVDWYINQMYRKEYESEPLPLSLTKENYKQGGLNDYILYIENPNVKGPINVSQYLQLVKNESPALQLPVSLGKVNMIPAKEMFLNVDVEAVIDKEIIPNQKKQLVTDKMQWTMNGRYLTKADLLILDLIDTGKWDRPVYFNNTSLNSINLDLSPYVVQEGDTFRLLPLQNPNPEQPLVNTEKMYGHMMHDFAWRELDNPDNYYHGSYLMFAQGQRANFNTLAEALIAEGDTEKAREVLAESLKVIPDQSIPYDVASVQSVALLLGLGETGKADDIAHTMSQRAEELLAHLEENDNALYELQKNISLFALNRFANFYHQAGRAEDSIRYQEIFERYYN